VVASDAGARDRHLALIELAASLKLLLYDGQGYWLCMKRLSQGRFHWWPTTADAQVPLSARELIILLWNGDPERAQMAQDWRRVA